MKVKETRLILSYKGKEILNLSAWQVINLLAIRGMVQVLDDELSVLCIKSDVAGQYYIEPRPEYSDE